MSKIDYQDLSAKIMDNKGDIICVEYKDGEVRECQE